ncbi:Metallo-dependent phosphatase [Hypoxylon sp. FL1150]|nr:Metallo-dependent phosphatase [Hypoxylon sp. FL1150]
MPGIVGSYIFSITSYNVRYHLQGKSSKVLGSETKPLRNSGRTIQKLNGNRSARHLPVDIAIHCGDLTGLSTLEEIRTALEQLKEINEPLKLVVPGSHDWTMDVPTFRENLGRVSHRVDENSVQKEYGEYGEAVELFKGVKDHGIRFLLEGEYGFQLDNGARLTVFASAYTPKNFDTTGFHYPPGQREFDISADVDVVVTHGPPYGILDFPSPVGKGCPGLMRAIVTIDPETSQVLESISTLTRNEFDTSYVAQAKASKRRELESQGYDAGAERPLRPGQTLFVNAAIEGSGNEEFKKQLPWVVEIDLPLDVPVRPIP